LDLIKGKELDVMLNVINTEDRQDYLLFTEQYMKSFSAIFTRDDDDIKSLSDLDGETLAVPKGFYTEELVRKYYPKINLYTTKNIHGSLLAVMEGYARATIGDLSVVSYLIKKYKTPGLRPVAKVEDKRFSSILHIAVRDDWQLLQSILQKAMDSVTDAEILVLRNEWFGNANEKLEFDQQERAYLKNKKELNVAIAPHYPPYSFYDQGVAKGLMPEYMRLLGAQAGVKLNFIWRRQGGIKNNSRADVVLGAVGSFEDRDGAYVAPPFARSIPGIFSKISNQYGSLKELQGKRLAVVKGSLYQRLLQEAYASIALHLVDDTEEAIEAVVFDKADAFLADYNESAYLLQSTGIISISALSSVKDSRFATDLSLVVSNEHPVLQKVIRKIIQRVDKAEIEILKHDWLQLTESEGDEIALTTWERDYLEKNNQFTFCSNVDWQPIDFKDDELHQPVGIAVDTLRLVEKKIGHSMRLNWIPSNSWPQSTKMFAEGQCDLVPAMISTNPRKKYALFSKPYMEYRVVVITRTEEPFVHSFEDISDKGVARQKGSGMINLLHNRYAGVSIVETENALDSFQKVASGEIYATVAILPVASHFITQYGLSNLKIAGFTDITYPISIAVNKNKPELFSMVEKALASIEDQQHREIFNHWVSIKVDQQFDYSLYLKTLAAILVLVLFFAYRQYQLGRYNRVLTDLSVMDKLTQIYNRSRLDEVLADQFNMLRRYQTPCSVIFIDIDHFKAINDSYGHLMGDKVLIQMAKKIDELRRITDIAGRWGGEEFMIICPNTKLEGAVRLSESIRVAIGKEKFAQGLRCTCSFGVAQMDPALTSDDLLQLADRALYQAKSEGRNRVVSTAEQNRIDKDSPRRVLT